MAFKKGESGNPGGRPRVPEASRLAIEALIPRAVAVLAEVMDDAAAPPAARVRASEILLNKIVPNLSTIDMTADIETRTTYSISDELPTPEEWEAERCTPEPTH